MTLYFYVWDKHMATSVSLAGAHFGLEIISIDCSERPKFAQLPPWPLSANYLRCTESFSFSSYIYYFFEAWLKLVHRTAQMEVGPGYAA